MKILATALLLCGSLVFAQAPNKDTKKSAPAAKVEKAKAEPKATKPETAGTLVGSKDGKTFHKSDCKHAAKIKAENKVTYANRAEAEKSGAKPCKVCKP